MKMRYLAAASAAVFLWSNAAQAEDFDGPHIEIRGGWDQTNRDKNIAPFKVLGSANGLSYGAGAGYDIALTDKVIAGVEIGVDLFENNDTATSGTTRFESKAKRDFEVGGRLGIKLSDNLLAFAKAGYSKARFTQAITIGGTTGNSRTEFTSDLDGVRAGAGLEFLLSKGLYAKSEYRYTNYQDGISRHQVLVAAGVRF